MTKVAGTKRAGDGFCCCLVVPTKAKDVSFAFKDGWSGGLMSCCKGNKGGCLYVCVGSRVQVYQEWWNKGRGSVARQQALMACVHLYSTGIKFLLMIMTQ